MTNTSLSAADIEALNIEATRLGYILIVHDHTICSKCNTRVADRIVGGSVNAEGFVVGGLRRCVVCCNDEIHESNVLELSWP